MTGLTRWLESARRLLNLDALALADDAGCLVVGAGSARRCEELAAIAPLVGNSGPANGLRIAAIHAGSAWLCAPTDDCDGDHWQAAILGCLRILGWNATAPQ